MRCFLRTDGKRHRTVPTPPHRRTPRPTPPSVVALSSDQEKVSARRTPNHSHDCLRPHPQTGGVSFRKSVLEPIFGNRLLSDYGDAPLSHDTADRIARAQSFEPSPELPERYDCVHGHFLALKYVSERVPCEFAVWFRDPAQRVVSRYLYGKRKGGRDHHSRNDDSGVLRDREVSEYVREVLVGI